MNKIQVTAQQRANAIEARDVMWPSVPEANVSPGLYWWRDGIGAHKKPDCGTVACFGGCCAWWPSFRRQGVVADPCGAAVVGSSDGKLRPFADKHLFGDDHVFDPRRSHPADHGFNGTDRALVLNRLNWLTENSEVVDSSLQHTTR